MSATAHLPPTPVRRSEPLQSSGISIPSSTVVSIGLGFVAFALLVLCVLTGATAVRIHKRVRQARARGENVTFTQAWRDNGGFWGFLRGGVDTAHPMLLGAGGYEAARMRMWEEIMWERQLLGLGGLDGDESGVGKEPIIWDGVVGGDKVRPEEEKRTDDGDRIGNFEPLCMTVQSPTEDAHPPPTLSMSVLILLPSPSSPPTTDEPDLPDLVIGSTPIVPMTNTATITTSPPTDHATSPTNPRKRLFVETEKEEEQGKDGGVQHLEYGSDSQGGGRAEWIKTKDGKWEMEGVGFVSVPPRPKKQFVDLRSAERGLGPNRVAPVGDVRFANLGWGVVR